jgi:hypothetical protein
MRTSIKKITPPKCLRRARVNREIISKNLTSVANYQKHN